MRKIFPWDSFTKNNIGLIPCTSLRCARLKLPRQEYVRQLFERETESNQPGQFMLHLNLELLLEISLVIKTGAKYLLL